MARIAPRFAFMQWTQKISSTPLALLNINASRLIL
jgi:hypothetical protein